MNDTQFDNFFNDKFREHAVPIPAHLWDKVVEGQFDQFIGNKLREAEVPVPNADSIWEKINDSLFDHFVADQLGEAAAPVPEGLWDRIADKQFDHFVAGTFTETEAPVPSGLWDRVADKQLDSFFAGKLKDHTSPVPDDMWERIMPEEEDDKVVFWWFRYPAAAVLLLGLLTAVAVGGYFYFRQPAETAVTRSGQPASEIGTNPAAGENNAAVNKQKNKDIYPANPVPGDQTAGEEKTSQENAAGNTGKRSKLPDVTDETLNSGLSNTGLTIIRKKKSIDLRPAHTTDLTQIPAVLFPGKETLTTTDMPEEIEAYPSRFRLAAFTIPSELNGYSMAQGMFEKQLSTANHTAQFRNVIICPADNKNRNTDWYLEAYISPDLPFKSFGNTTASAQYLLKKDSAESMQVSYSAGLRLVKPITDNFLVKAGLQYSQVNQKYVYRTENEVKTTTVVTVRTIIRAPGDTVVVQDTSVLQTVGFRTNTVRNRFRTIDIPVTLGYQFGNDDLKIGLNAGVVVNLNSWYQGVILDSTLSTVPISKTGNGVYKTNIGLGLIGSISVVKRLSDDMHVFFEPYFRYNLSDMTTSQAAYRQKFSVGGLSIGLRVNLNRK